MKTLILSTAGGGWMFSLTSLAAFVVVALMASRRLARDRHSHSTILLLLTASALGFFLGERFFALSWGQWCDAYSTLALPPAGHRSLAGGVAGLAFILYLTWRWLCAGWSASDAFAVAMPAGLAISGIGCFFAGCCYGLPTSLPWGISYDISSHAFLDQLGRGWVHPGDAGSLPVHPVQLYLSMGCLALAILVSIKRKKWRTPGTPWLFSLLGYGILAFLLEFFRAKGPEVQSNGVTFGMTGTQWILLVLVTGAMALFVVRLKRPIANPSEPPSVLRQDTLTMALWLLFLTGRKWIPAPETLLVLMMLVPLTLFRFVALYRRHTVPGFRWVVPAVILVSVGLMSQKNVGREGEPDEIVFTGIGISGMAGSYVEDLYSAVKHNDCGSEWVDLVSIGSQRRTYWQGAIDFSHNRWKGKYYKYAIGVRGYFGQEHGGMETDYPASGNVAGVAPYISFQWRYFGLGAGLMLGQNKIGIPRDHGSFNKFSDGDIIAPDHVNSWIIPAVTLRGGPSDIAFGEISFPAAFPSASPYPLLRAGVGSGFGRTDGTRVVIGYCDGLFIQASYPVSDYLVMEAFYADRLGSGNQEKRILSVGIQVRIPREKK